MIARRHSPSSNGDWGTARATYGNVRSMPSQGPHARFRRALLSRNVTMIEAAAPEIGRLRVEDALSVLVVMA
jgi:hypothetical protein